MNKSEAKKIIEEMRGMIRHRHSPEKDLPPHQAGMSLFLKNEFEKAFLAFEQAVKLNSKNFFSHYYLGRSQRRLGKYEASILSFSKAIELNPVHAPSTAYLGDSLLKENRLIEAEKYFRQALELQFDNLVALRGLVRLMQSRK